MHAILECMSPRIYINIRAEACNVLINKQPEVCSSILFQIDFIIQGLFDRYVIYHLHIYTNVCRNIFK